MTNFKYFEYDMLNVSIYVFHVKNIFAFYTGKRDADTFYLSKLNDPNHFFSWVLTAKMMGSFKNLLNKFLTPILASLSNTGSFSFCLIYFQRFLKVC